MACTGTCALSAALQTILWLGVYIWTIVGLRLWLLRTQATLSFHDLKQQEPSIRWLHPAHIGLSYLVVLAGLLASIGIATAQAEPPLVFGLGTLLWVISLNTFNGIFELATGVCPIYGVTLKRHQSQRFIRHARVRLLGLLRLLLSLILLGVAWGMLRAVEYLSG